MIDQDKMRALAKCLRADADFAGERESGSFDLRYEAADAIDLLLAEVEAAAADKRDAERYRAHIRYEYESLYLPGARKKGLRPLTIKEYKTSADQVADAALSQRQEES
ncbi:hypothetical protein [Burkholderia multivorans]|uniref:hypothetical protein n=1 Tax=Burkholderia multivorans TaxID=87883 RepID=UPI000D0000BA|nr:hypothetical protein [Burkholderia multivorans]PRH11007.1 hypothetical protein C6T61_07525 [Burkholderia multivorans]